MRKALFPSYLFIEQPYELVELLLGSLVSDTFELAVEQISKLEPQLKIDYHRRPDTEILYHSSAETAAHAKVSISSILAAKSDRSKDAKVKIEAKGGYEYYLRHPRESFERQYKHEDVRDLLELGKRYNSEAYFVVGYRTLVDAHLVAANDKSWRAGADFEVPQLTGDPKFGGGG